MAGATANSNKILITEFMAINSNGLFDEDGDRSDWIELYNNTDNAIDLAGWYLTDNALQLKEWQFPSVTLAKGAYMVVYASGKNRIDPSENLHTNFKLSGSGEFLAVCEPDTTISHAYSPLYPAQQQDVSYGIFQGQEVFFSTSTPSVANIAGSIPFAPAFSHSRGFYETAFNLSLSVPGGDGAIYYTTNGTRPTKTTGTLYTAPLRITTTTPVSAVVINSANVSSAVVSNTYLFLNDVIRQPKAPAGYPTDWKESTAATSIAADYEMDTRVTTNAAYKDKIIASLKSLPTMNIVTNIGYLFSNVEDVNNGGIYIFTGLPHTESKAWERPASVEYFDVKTGKEFQINCRLKLHGGNSRRPTNSPKHGFELGFKSTYGPTKLNFDIFNEKQSAKEFNSLIVRAGYNYTWVKNAAAQQTAAQYIQDSWAKTTQLDMGQISAHETFVHLYLNGLYWGVYNISEEINKDFLESYLGGLETDYDVIKEKETDTTGPTDGTMVAWNSFKSQITGVATSANYQKMLGNNADGTVNPAYSKLLNPENYIDYMLINYYIGNGDWDANNWSVGRNRVTNTEGFRFFCWDTETSMTALTENKIITGTAGNPTAFMQYLKKNADFKVLMADRIKMHLLDAGGALTPPVVAERYEKLADEIELAMIGESARWSDWYTPYAPYTVNGHWLPRKTDLINNYFPQRTDVLLTQLKTASLYPTVDAPAFTHASGAFSSAINLGMTTNSGTIYYTTDGSDPRVNISGIVNASAKTYTSAVAINSNTTIKARAKTSVGEWSAITIGEYIFGAPNAVEQPLAEQLACSNYPNPFSKSTRIQLTMPFEGDINIAIYGLDGRLVKNLFNGKAMCGLNSYEWQSEETESGIYICRIDFEGRSAYLKLIKR